jgi:type I restriction enzyme S subunit
VYSTVRPNQRHFGLIKQVPENFLASTGFAVIRGRPNVAHTDFIYWFLVQDNIVEYMQTIAENSTSAYPPIRPSDLEELGISLPSLPEQRRIASILGVLDDKIELNRRTNVTLEQMTRALFKSWFVDFDPVRAKIVGRWRRGESLPGVPAELYNLFPDRLVASKLGEIPNDWNVQPLGDSYNLTMGQSPPGSTYNEAGDGLPFFQGNADFGFRYPSNRRYCTTPTRTADSGDTLVSVRAPVGAINMAWERCCIGRGLSALRHKSGSSSFTYYAVEALQEEIQQYEHTGTVFGAINRRQFEELPTLEPPAGVVAMFQQMVSDNDVQIRENVLESRTLGTLRDSLLPSLVSGNLRIPATVEPRVEQA